MRQLAGTGTRYRRAHAAPLAVFADDGVTLDSVVAPGPNQADEPVAKELSLEKAAHFQDSAALTWQKDRKCFTCHTNFAYLYARPAISAGSNVTGRR
jgi:squalene-hopene/tetraprenyl-beta-curcumene cyclase